MCPVVVKWVMLIHAQSKTDSMLTVCIIDVLRSQVSANLQCSAKDFGRETGQEIQIKTTDYPLNNSLTFKYDGIVSRMLIGEP